MALELWEHSPAGGAISVLVPVPGSVVLPVPDGLSSLAHFYFRREETSRLTAWATPRASMAEQAQTLLNARGVARAVKQTKRLIHGRARYNKGHRDPSHSDGIAETA